MIKTTGMLTVLFSFLRKQIVTIFTGAGMKSLQHWLSSASANIAARKVNLAGGLGLVIVVHTII